MVFIISVASFDSYLHKWPQVPSIIALRILRDRFKNLAEEFERAQPRELPPQIQAMRQKIAAGNNSKPAV